MEQDWNTSGTGQEHNRNRTETRTAHENYSNISDPRNKTGHQYTYETGLCQSFLKVEQTITTLSTAHDCNVFKEQFRETLWSKGRTREEKAQRTRAKLGKKRLLIPPPPPPRGNLNTPTNWFCSAKLLRRKDVPDQSHT
jgi:hypothetical protein